VGADHYIAGSRPPRTHLRIRIRRVEGCAPRADGAVQVWEACRRHPPNRSSVGRGHEQQRSIQLGVAAYIDRFGNQEQEWKRGFRSNTVRREDKDRDLTDGKRKRRGWDLGSACLEKFTPMPPGEATCARANDGHPCVPAATATHEV